MGSIHETDERLQVQQEDVTLCEAVQRGLRSPAYDCGRCEHVLLGVHPP